MLGDAAESCAASTSDFVDIINRLTSSDAQPSLAAAAAESATWSYYSWEDAVAVVFATLANKVALLIFTAAACILADLHCCCLHTC
jgi:hypothetical protein